MPTAAQQHVAGASVLVDGTEVDPTFRASITEIRVRDSLVLPDTAVVRISDPKGGTVDSHPLDLGKSLEIKLASPKDHVTRTVFKGEIVAHEPEFSQDGCTVVVRAYDKAHRLNRQRKTRTFQQMSASDIVRKIVGEAGLSPGKVDATSMVYEFFQQSDETDWDFGRRLALRHDYELNVDDDKVNFCEASKGNGQPVTLAWNDQLLSFKPRVSGVQQVKEVTVRGYDVKGKIAINRTVSSATTAAEAGVKRDDVVGKFDGGTVALGDRTVESSADADAVAGSALARLANAYYEAVGKCIGEPRVHKGALVEIKGVGTRMGGKFVVASSEHVFKGGSGYFTTFQITGRSARTLLDLVNPPEKRDWGTGFVVGIVTNNNDPDQLGRVRVKYPSLSDQEESAWARVVTPSTGNGRGLLMLPQPDEEVVVGFENADTRRPIVLGSVFNGKDKPGDELLSDRDGSFVVASDEKGLIHTKKDLTLKSDQKMIIEVSSDREEKADGKAKMKTGSSFEIEAGSDVKIKGVGITVEASGSLKLKGATVEIESSGPASLKGALVNVEASGITSVKGSMVNLG
jgi:phage protein D